MLLVKAQKLLPNTLVQNKMYVNINTHKHNTPRPFSRPFKNLKIKANLHKNIYINKLIQKLNENRQKD